MACTVQSRRARYTAAILFLADNRHERRYFVPQGDILPTSSARPRFIMSGALRPRAAQHRTLAGASAVPEPRLLLAVAHVLKELGLVRARAYVLRAKARAAHGWVARSRNAVR